MAYINQEKKAAIAAALKLVVPTGWKYSLSIRNHSTLTCTISSAPFDLLRAVKASEYFNPETAAHLQLNEYHIHEQFADECVADVFEQIIEAMNGGNHDNSDPMTDYFDVGWYTHVQLGSWNKPFTCTAEKIPASA